MTYSETIDKRITHITRKWKNTGTRKMFGGVCHLLNGNMFCGVYKDFLILRLGEAAAGRALKRPFVKPFDITGKPMKGWVMVAPAGIAEEDALNDWLNQARGFVSGLPSK